jgi:hypothetical protein
VHGSWRDLVSVWSARQITALEGAVHVDTPLASHLRVPLADGPDEPDLRQDGARGRQAHKRIRQINGPFVETSRPLPLPKRELCVSMFEGLRACGS